MPYNGLGSGGANLGPSNPALLEATRARIAALRAADPSLPAALPADWVTTSASGLDPHISLAAAQLQLGRVSRQRHLPLARVQQLLDAHTERPLGGWFGEAQVNVLALNLALDASQ
jgi:K+-transporting ATPase ATPase C chain